jgi:actin-related protein 8
MDTTMETETPSTAHDPTPQVNGNKIKVRDTKHKPTSKPRFKYTSFPVKGFNILPTRNITSQYAKSDTSTIQGILAPSEDTRPDVSCQRKGLGYRV